MVRVAWVLIWVIFLPVPGWCQGKVMESNRSPPAFEVASVRPHTGPLRVIMGFESSGTQVTMQGYSLFGLVMEAYGLKSHELSFGKVDPDEDVYYDIRARAEGGGSPSRAEFRRMLQTLLVDRFHLLFHREKRMMPVYALVVGKRGVTLQRSAGDAVSSTHVGVNGRKQNINAIGVTMEELAEDIGNSFQPDQPVVDRTGLTGRYDFRLEASPAFRLRDPQPGDASVVDSIEEQLGLRLERERAEVEVLVVDRMGKPTEN